MVGWLVGWLDGCMDDAWMMHGCTDVRMFWVFGLNMDR